MKNVINGQTSYLGRGSIPQSIEVGRSDRSFVYDKYGQEYVDFSTNWCGILGWNLPVVKKAIRDFSGPFYVDPTYQYEVWEDLARLLVSHAPGHMTHVFRATGGTEAVEIALQAAMSYTKRSQFISTGGYHGHSFATLGLGFPHYRERYPTLPIAKVISPPYDEKAGQKVVELLSHQNIAAYISEPILCNQGVLIPTQRYFEIVQQACRKYDTVFIMDEVATSFDRTGALFASEHYHLEPDIICLGKGLTGGNAVLGATLMNQPLSEAMNFEFSYYSTFAWQPLNTFITLRYVQYLFKHQKHISQKVRQLSRFFVKELKKLPMVTEVRVQGLAIGVDFQHDSALTVRDKCLHKGLLVDCLNSTTVTLFPPATMSMTVAQKGLNILSDVTSEITNLV